MPKAIAVNPKPLTEKEVAECEKAGLVKVTWPIFACNSPKCDFVTVEKSEFAKHAYSFKDSGKMIGEDKDKRPASLHDEYRVETDFDYRKPDPFAGA